MLFRILLVFLYFFPASVLANMFDLYFESQTMRIDYFHTGNKNNEIFSLDQVYRQGEWAGSRVNLIDTLNLGKYLARIIDAETNRLIYSRGFSSIYGEWETTAEASKRYRTFHESVLLPFPKKSIQLIIAKRDSQGQFKAVWKTGRIEPDSHFINHAPIHNQVEVRQVHRAGAPAEKVDLLILGDGYAKNEQQKFQNDLTHFSELLLNTVPFHHRQDDFNINGILAVAEQSGISEPRKNIWKNNVLGCTFNTFDLPRYVLTLKNKAVRDIAANVPYDHIMILFNSERYGGGGIFNLYAISFSGSKRRHETWWADYVFIHEFGHSFGGLADEYYASAVSYENFYLPNVEPWEPNITALLDGQLKWKHLVDHDTPIPTPWDKATYDSLVIEKHKYKSGSDTAVQLEKEIKNFMRSQKYWGKVGAFEGAGYQSRGLYRPFLDCRMFSKRLIDFDPVCQEAIERIIDFYSH